MKAIDVAEHNSTESCIYAEKTSRQGAIYGYSNSLYLFVSYRVIG